MATVLRFGDIYGSGLVGLIESIFAVYTDAFTVTGFWTIMGALFLITHYIKGQDFVNTVIVGMFIINIMFTHLFMIQAVGLMFLLGAIGVSLIIVMALVKMK